MMKKSPIKPCVLALFLVTSQSACAHVYEPAASPQIKIRGDGVLVKDGREARTLADVVRGNPAAEAEARLADSASLTGSVLMLGGPTILLGTEIAGYSLSAGQKTLSPVSIAVLVSGAVVGFGTMVVGAVFSGNGQRHAHNAINLYNDGLAPSPPPARAATVPVVP